MPTYVAAFYRNTVTHYFIDRAILEVALVQAADEDPASDVDVVAATWTRALALRDLLKYEFFFATKAEFDTQLRYETDLVRPGWANESATAREINEVLAGSRLLLAHRESRQHFADELAATVAAIAVVRSLALKN